MLKYIFGFFKYFWNHRVSKLAFITCDSKIYSKSRIGLFATFWNSSLQNYSYVGGRSRVVNTDIGKFCSIANSCNIGLASHSINFLSTSPLFTERKNSLKLVWTKANIHDAFPKRVTIGNDVWIGHKVTILGGVTIGNGCVVGTGAIVTHDLPDYAIAVGIPAKVIRYRFDNEIIKKLLLIKWWNADEDLLKKNIKLFQTEKFDLSLLD